MTTINRLWCRGLKCGDFDHQLSAVNVIVGRNYVGKTTRLEAIRLALVGYLPELGKLPSATLGLARNGSIDLGIETGAGNVSRAWAKGKKPTCTGTLPETPAVLMDSREYFGLGPKDQVRYVFARCNVEAEYNADKLKATVKNIKLPENTEQTEAALARVVAMVEDTAYERAQHEETVQEWLENLTAQIKGAHKAARDQSDAMTNLVRGMTGLQATEQGGAVADQSAQILDVRNQITDANRELTLLRGGVTRHGQTAAKRDVWTQALAGDMYKDLEENKALFEIKVKELQDKIIAHPI
jgi:DNA repair exonuclease SbcCD ATPase subunit